ncbi:MAG: RluA family pseudouridine synthase, partial [Verrucomicrobiae bacterium]|nr:RluA family pseudouridine synthase [Verrucomicrobiae bacterium]
GCLVAAKTDAAHQELSRQFADRETEKTYLCVVQGHPKEPSGMIENRIGRHPVNRQRMAVRPEPQGKEAVTGYTVLNRSGDGSWALIKCDLYTGRTHQIRVHMKESLGCPILGDEIYAQPSRQSVQPGRLMLHARFLTFTHPETKERLTFESPLPSEFRPFVPEGGI